MTKKLKLRTKPYKYQKEGVRLIEDKFKLRALLADEMGLGKSLQFLMVLARNQPRTFPALIICPADLKLNWQNEALIHYGIRAVVLSGRRPPKGLVLAPRTLYIINYEILGGWRSALRKARFKLIGLDESHYLKNPATQRTRHAIRICLKAKAIIAMTGSPITMYPAEVYTTLQILRPDKFKSFFAFAMKYCGPQLKRWGWEYKGATRIPQLNRKLNRLVMVRRTMDEVAEQLPKSKIIVVPLEITRREEYNFAVKDFIRWLRKKKGLRKATRAEKAARLVWHGYIKRFVARLKFKAVCQWIQDFLDGTDEKIIIFACHTIMLEKLTERFPNSVLVNGSVTGRKREAARLKFRTDPNTRIFFGNIDAAGVGWDGTAASKVAFVELAWRPGKHAQAQGRVRRIGQKKRRCLFYYLIAKNTIEEKLCAFLQKGMKVVESVIDGKAEDHESELDIYTELERAMKEEMQ